MVTPDKTFSRCSRSPSPHTTRIILVEGKVIEHEILVRSYDVEL